MQFFLDTADLNEIRALADSGLVDGVTTNPSLIAQQEGVNFKDLIQQMAHLVPGPISAEVAATDYETMQREADVLAGLAPNVAVKLPLTEAGLRVCKNLSDRNVMTNVTLCFSAAQALLAAKAGATFISVFVGRLDDIGQDGIGALDEIIQMLRQHPFFDSQVLAASIRHPQHVVQAAKVGADIVTLPPKILRQLYGHPLTDKGLSAFVADWQKTGQSIL